MSVGKIRIEKKRLRALLRDVDMRCFAIPKLQREFVWDGPKAAKLLDSIYKGMPIGIVLVWETPRSKKLYLRQRYHVLPAFDDGHRKIWFLIDGQQRVSAIHWAKEGKTLRNGRRKDVDFLRVVLSLENEHDGQQIRYRKQLPGKYVPLSWILHPQWRHKLGALNKGKLARVQACRKRILNYVMHFMYVRMKVDEVRECFLRINTQGMKVTTADAIFTRAEAVDLRDFVHEVRNHLDQSFQDMEDLPILWAIAAMRGAVEARGVSVNQVIERLEKEVGSDKRRKEKLSREWRRLRPCFGKAVDYLRQNYKVLDREYLYSDYMVSMLALFFFHNGGAGPDRRQREQIRKWFWATTVGARYSGRNFLRCIKEDVVFFERLARKGNARFRYPPQVDKVDIRKTQYAAHTGVGSAFYSLLLLQRPVSILDEGINEIPLEKYATSTNRKDRHHIFPRRPLLNSGIQVTRYNSICNICLLTAEENQRIGSRLPRSYLGDIARRKRLFSKKMNRHLIPAGKNGEIWDRNMKRGFGRFISSREDLISQRFEREAGIRLFRKD